MRTRSWSGSADEPLGAAAAAGSSRLPLSEMVKLDYLYMAGWSLWIDVTILLRTAPSVPGRRGQ